MAEHYRKALDEIAGEIGQLMLHFQYLLTMFDSFFFYPPLTAMLMIIFQGRTLSAKTIQPSGVDRIVLVISELVTYDED